MHDDIRGESALDRYHAFRRDRDDAAWGRRPGLHPLETAHRSATEHELRDRAADGDLIAARAASSGRIEPLATPATTATVSVHPGRVYWWDGEAMWATDGGKRWRISSSIAVADRYETPPGELTQTHAGGPRQADSPSMRSGRRRARTSGWVVVVGLLLVLGALAGFGVAALVSGTATLPVVLPAPARSVPSADVDAIARNSAPPPPELPDVVVHAVRPTHDFFSGDRA